VRGDLRGGHLVTPREAMNAAMMSQCGLAFGAKRALYRSNMCRVSRGRQLLDGAATKGRGDRTPTRYWTHTLPATPPLTGAPKITQEVFFTWVHESYTVTAPLPITPLHIALGSIASRGVPCRIK
jgi:hypothetical protein